MKLLWFSISFGLLILILLSFLGTSKIEEYQDRVNHLENVIGQENVIITNQMSENDTKLKLKLDELEQYWPNKMFESLPIPENKDFELYEIQIEKIFQSRFNKAIKPSRNIVSQAQVEVSELQSNISILSKILFWY